MPFGVVFDQVYDRIFVPLLEGVGYRVRRADTLLNQRAIMRDVVEGIRSANLIWADLTGGNPNVFYELGMAQALGKKCILVAQRRDDIPSDLRAYRNYVYHVEFVAPPELVDDLSAEMVPFLAAALKGEVLFGSPFSDFAGAEVAEAPDEAPDGILDRIAEFQRVGDELKLAFDDANAISDRFSERQTDLTAKLASAPEGVDPIEHAVRVGAEVGALWDETASAMEHLLDGKLAALTLIVERGARAMVEFGRAGGDEARAREALTSLRTLAATAAKASAAQTNLAQVTRENSKYLGALRKPGNRLASVYERFAASFDRIAALADADDLQG
jgi:hypothetical protein